MMKKRHFNLWVTFVLSVFLIMIISACLIFLSALLLIHLGIDIYFKERAEIRIIIPLITSTCIGTLLSMLVGKTVLKPIRTLNDALKEVSKGNFSIALIENQKIEELQEMFHSYNRMVKELSGIETLRQDFVTSVSHEFKTPLSNIEGYVTLLQNKDLSEEKRTDYAQIILSNTKQLSTLTSNILKISKLENQTKLPELTHFCLDEQIRQAILLCESKWEEKNISFDLSLDSIYYYGNEELLTQVWVNLIDNAIKFSNIDSEIKIIAQLSYDSKEVLVSIKDYGIGFDPSLSAHIFEKFFQADPSRQADGNGLGLALVHQVITMMGGHIETTSKINAGATFLVHLPLH